MSDDRDRGVEFGDLTEDLESEAYPLTKTELLEQYGDRQLEHASGSSSVRELLGEEGDDEYESADEVHETILNMVGEEAVGREGYSDRGTGSPDEGDGEEDESF